MPARSTTRAKRVVRPNLRYKRSQPSLPSEVPELIDKDGTSLDRIVDAPEFAKLFFSPKDLRILRSPNLNDQSIVTINSQLSQLTLAQNIAAPKKISCYSGSVFTNAYGVRPPVGDLNNPNICSGSALPAENNSNILAGKSPKIAKLILTPPQVSKIVYPFDAEHHVALHGYPVSPKNRRKILDPKIRSKMRKIPTTSGATAVFLRSKHDNTQWKELKPANVTKSRSLIPKIDFIFSSLII